MYACYMYAHIWGGGSVMAVGYEHDTRGANRLCGLSQNGVMML